MRFLIQWLITSIAVAAAVLLVPGIEVSGNGLIAVIVTALLLGVLNATLGLILRIGTIGCIVMSLGLFNVVINAGLLWLASWITVNWFRIDFVVDGFWPALWGGAVISIVSGVLYWFAREEPREKRDELVV